MNLILFGVALLLFLFSSWQLWLSFKRWKAEQVPRCLRGSGHVWRWIIEPYMRQCARCHLIDVKEDGTLSDELKAYLGYLGEYHQRKMFPKTAVTGYHRLREGCCPLPADDPIHDPTLFHDVRSSYPKKDVN